MDFVDGKKKEFNEALAELIELATVSGNKITKDQIHLYLKDILENEEQYEFIYKYLIESKVEIEGYQKETTEVITEKEVVGKVLSEQEKAFYDMYLNELKEIESNVGKKQELFSRYIEGEKKLANDITSLYLEDVIRISKDYCSGPLSQSELVAEGNLALYEAILLYKNDDKLIDRFEEYLFSEIGKAMSEAINEEIGSGRTSHHLLDRINALNDTSTKLAKKLEREATLEELAKHLGLGEEEIKELMKISIDALTIDTSDGGE